MIWRGKKQHGKGGGNSGAQAEDLAVLPEKCQTVDRPLAVVCIDPGWFRVGVDERSWLVFLIPSEAGRALRLARGRAGDHSLLSIATC